MPKLSSCHPSPQPNLPMTLCSCQSFLWQDGNVIRIIGVKRPSYIVVFWRYLKKWLWFLNFKLLLHFWYQTSIVGEYWYILTPKKYTADMCKSPIFSLFYFISFFLFPILSGKSDIFINSITCTEQHKF